MNIKTNIAISSFSKSFSFDGSLCLLFSCNSKSESQEMNAKPMEITAKEILEIPTIKLFVMAVIAKHTRN